MRINTNIASLTAQRALANTTRAFARALERLSSGKRINRAGDDAAGLAISERLESQRRGLAQVARNLNDANGFLTTAEGAISSQTDILHRMHELALQASSGTLSISDRKNLDSEFQELRAEYERIATQTQFNGVNLLDGTFGTRSIQAGVAKGDGIEFSVGSTLEADSVDLGIDASTVEGNGSFTQSATTASGLNNTQDIAFADLDADGNMDLAQVSNGGRVVVQMGDGAGHFGSATTYYLGASSGGTYSKIAAIDLSGTGRKDLVVANRGYDSLSVLMNNGSGAFSIGTTINLSVGSDVRGIGVGDFNNDGREDFATANSSNSSTICLSNGDGTFSRPSTITGLSPAPYGAPAIADFNLDGHLDLAIYGNSSRRVEIRLGNGDGSFSMGQTITTPNTAANISSVVMTDFNNDEITDLLICEWGKTTAHAYQGAGDGNFTLVNSLTLGSGTTSYSLAAADINNDGNSDFFVDVDNSVVTYLGDGAGGFSLGTTTAVSAMGFGGSIETADLDNDGVIDFGVPITNAFTSQIFLQGSSLVTQTSRVEFSILDQSNAQNLLSILGASMDYLNQQRVQLGAVQSRLEFGVSSSLIAYENLSAARSQIIDADMAEETAELTRAQILQQAGVSVLGQANTAMQMVLGLLRF